MNKNAETKNNVPEITNSGNINAASNFLGKILSDLATFAERIDKLSVQTRLIILILGLSLIMPLSVGISVYLILIALSLRGG